MITARKNNYFIPLSIWILLTRSYDIICTFQFTPDFSKEKNPLSSVVGLGGIGVTIAVSVVMVYTIFALYKYEKNKNKVLPEEKNMPYNKFYKYYNSFGKQGTRILVDGYVFSRTFAVAGILTTIMWLLINNTTWYYGNYHNPYFYYLIIIGTLILFNISFIKIKFKEYQLKQ